MSAVNGAAIAKHDGSAIPEEDEAVALAFAKSVADRGYADVSLADVAAGSGVDIERLRDRFNDKDGCFLSIYENAIGGAERQVTDAIATAFGQWPDHVVAGLSALLSYVDENRAVTRLCLADTLGTGPAVRTRYEQTLERFTRLLGPMRAAGRHGEAMPEVLEEAIAGGVLWFLRDRLVNGRERDLADLLPDLARFVLTPYVGPVEAAAAARRSR